jgi:hypothetical protein
MTDALRHLDDYRAMLARVRREGDGDGCRGLRAGLADRAFEAEAVCRVLLAETLTSTNQLRDSGFLHASLADLADRLGDREQDLGDFVAEELQEVKAATPSIPAEAFDAIRAFLRQRKIRVRYDRERDELVSRGLAFDGAEQVTRVRVSEKAGDLGRVGVDQFFGAEGRASPQVDPRSFAPADCHHRGGPSGGENASTDAYATAVASLSACREVFYGHARKLSEQGYHDARAAETVVALVVVAIVGLVVGSIALIVSGLTSGGVSMAATGFAIAAFAGFFISVLILFILLV